MTMRIALTQGKVALIDDEDAELVGRYAWHAYRNRRAWYAVTNVTRADGRRTTLSMHRLLLDFPAGEIDHHDGNGLNNQRANLRVCTRSQNACNRRLGPTNTSGYKGVRFGRSAHTSRTRPWEAQIRVNGRQLRLGSYATAEEAARAYDTAARLHFGAFARLNFPVDEAAA